MVKRYIILLFCLSIFPCLIFAQEFKAVTYVTPNAGRVIFDHDVHLNKLSKNCTECHNALFHITKKNPTVTMADMEKDKKSCGACHGNTRAFALTECTRCHIVKEVPINIPDFGAVVFSHKFHLGMYGCSECHNKIFKAGPGNPHVTMKQMEGGVSCGSCHDGSTAFTVKENCTKCHAVKDLDLPSEAFFSHNFHLEMFKCGDCHSRLFIAGPNRKSHTMAQMESGQSCGGCHDGKSAFSVTGDCGKCHRGTPKNIPFKETDALFSHAFHLNIYRCTDCHSGIFTGGPKSKRYTMADMENNKSCGACHDGSIAFSVAGSCDRCHKSTHDINFNIPDIGKVLFSHSFHYLMFKCDDCHNGVFLTGTRSTRYTMRQMEQGKSCGACHNGKSAFTVAGNCGKCHPVRDITMTDDARFSHNKHLEMYRCSDCHNKLFVAGPDNKRWKMTDMEKGKSCGACHDGSIGFSVRGDCNKCHTSTVEITFNVRQTGKTVFSHKFHTGMYSCTDCHYGVIPLGDAARRNTMADMEQGKSCGACHEGKTAFTVKENCTKCHPTKEINFPVGAAFSHAFHTGMYRCNDCHDALFIPGAGNRHVSMAEMEKGTSCGACHDGKTAFAVTGTCEKCHPVTKAIKYQVPRNAGDVTFSHKIHTVKGYGCTDCHNKIIFTGPARKDYTMREMEDGKFCGACHGFTMAFSVKEKANCERCHGEAAGGTNPYLFKGPPE
ncbi:MAG: cytochrome c3 family protein [Geobacter sp.]|nr:cytochrome c3 family protein [Geobacter sp.]